LIKGSENYSIQREKKGRRKLGDLLTFSNGKKVYIKPFSQGDFYRGDEKSVSAALRKDKCHLWMESHKVMELKFGGVEFIGFEERNTGDIYLTHLSTFRSSVKSMPVRIGTRDVRAVALKHFHVRLGNKKIKLPQQNK